MKKTPGIDGFTEERRVRSKQLTLKQRNYKKNTQQYCSWKQTQNPRENFIK